MMTTKAQSNKWKIDYDKRIIYLSSFVANKDILALFTELNSNDKGLLSGPLDNWKIQTIEQ